LVIYASEHASLAAWEKIVHVASFENLSTNLLLVKIELPDEIEIQTIPLHVLVKRWDSFPFCDETVSYGSSFLQNKDIWPSKYLQIGLNSSFFTPKVAIFSVVILQMPDIQ